MKNALLAAALLFSQLTFAAGDDYKQHIANDRIILMFNSGTSAETKANVIHASGLVKDFTHLNGPNLTICIVGEVQQALQYFNTIPEVRFTSFFITDGSGHYAGVLDEFFIKLKDKSYEPQLRQLLEANHLSGPVANHYVPNLYTVKIPHTMGLNTIEWTHIFRTENFVEYAVVNYLVNPLVTSNDTYYNREWYLSNQGTPVQGNGTPGADMDVDSAWTLTTGDPSIKIGLIDSGTDTLHQDLAANLLPGHDAINDSTDGYPTPTYNEDGHGTCTAGILVAIKDNGIGVAGVAPSCKVIPVRSFYYVSLQGNILPYSTAAIFVDAIGWAVDTGGADILSNSWGLPPNLIGFLDGGTFPVNDVIEHVYTTGRGGKGTALFFSSGNDNDSTSTIWPSSLDHTFAVNATNMCDKRKYPGDCSGASENWGGDYGAHLDFSAPGVKIWTTDMLGAHGFSGTDYTGTFNGTSAACPNAAGIGALLLSIRPDLHAEDLRAIIAISADKVGGYNYDSAFYYGAWSKELGYGRVNAYKALQEALVYSGIPAIENDVNIHLYPNPAHNILNVGYDGKKEAQLNVYDVSGKLCLQQLVHAGLNTYNLGNLKAGMYITRISTDAQVSTGKLIVTQ